MRTFNLSQDPYFLEKLEDVVGLYLDPPEHDLALRVDDKSQIQTLNRTQPGLPLKKSRCGTTHGKNRDAPNTLIGGSECGRRNRDLHASPASSPHGVAGFLAND